MSDQKIIDKIRSLPPEKVAEVEDFVDSLRLREQDHKEGSTSSTEEGANVDWKSLEGKWVAVENEVVVEHGTRLVDVVRSARAMGIPKPYVFYVEATREGAAKLGL